MHRQCFHVVVFLHHRDAQVHLRQVRQQLVCDKDYLVHQLMLQQVHQNVEENFHRLNQVVWQMRDVQQNLDALNLVEDQTFLVEDHLHQRDVVVVAALRHQQRMDYFLDAVPQVQQDAVQEDVVFQKDYFLDAVHEFQVRVSPQLREPLAAVLVHLHVHLQRLFARLLVVLILEKSLQEVQQLLLVLNLGQVWLQLFSQPPSLQASSLLLVWHRDITQ
jgi:hypothetical protein